MKKTIFFLVITVLFFACKTEPHFTVKGNIEGSDSIAFNLMKRVDGKVVTIDSAVSKSGAFKLTGKVEYPEMIQLVAMNTPYRLSFYLENSEISISGTLDSLSDAKITGSKAQYEYQSVIDSTKTLDDKYTALYTDYQVAKDAKDDAKVAAIEKEAEKIQAEMTELQKSFVKNNPSSYVAPAILKSLSYEMEASEIEAAINAMDTSVANTPVIKELKGRVEVMKTVAIGQKAPDFTLNDVNGTPVALSSKIGSKLLLIDFWAGWCGPCRQENPNVVKVYNEFHKKGFDVFGVSLDRTKEEWLKAIADDKLTWTHVSDIQYWNNAAAKLYAVNSIPANFLLDETGTIIAHNLRGEDLANKVKEILGSK